MVSTDQEEFNTKAWVVQVIHYRNYTLVMKEKRCVWIYHEKKYIGFQWM